MNRDIREDPNVLVVDLSTAGEPPAGFITANAAPSRSQPASTSASGTTTTSLPLDRRIGIICYDSNGKQIPSHQLPATIDLNHSESKKQKKLVRNFKQMNNENGQMLRSKVSRDRLAEKLRQRQEAARQRD